MINVSFSGGRSSAMMLDIMLQTYAKEELAITFANTGKERQETLDFVNEVQTRWDLDIKWLEATFRTPGKEDTIKDCVSYKEVDYSSASTYGEPFSNMINHLSYMPNRVKRLCTIYLKIIPIEKYMVDNYGEDFDTCMGIRFDEPKRVRKYKNDKILPLNDFRVTNKQVREFWEKQDFDLQLKDYEGNCDLCFLKGIDKRRTILRSNPELAEWWINQEENFGQTFESGMPMKKILTRSQGKNFKIYKDYLESDHLQQSLDISCFCGD